MQGSNGAAAGRQASHKPPDLCVKRFNLGQITGVIAIDKGRIRGLGLGERPSHIIHVDHTILNTLPPVWVEGAMIVFGMFVINVVFVVIGADMLSCPRLFS